MSWSSLHPGARGRLVALALALAALGTLAACGFKPVYGDRGLGVRTSEAMGLVEVAPISGGLVATLVRNNLLDRINPNGEPSAPRHRLEVTLTPVLSGLLVQPDASTTRYNYTILGRYKLIDMVTGEVALEGGVRGEAGYNVVESEYATLIAKQNAERRAALAISEDLTLRVSLFLDKEKS